MKNDFDFREAWDRIAALEGGRFHTDRGLEFSYRFKRTFVVVSPGEQSIPRTNFEKVFKRRASPSAVPRPAVQGQRYIEALYADPRFESARS